MKHLLLFSTLVFFSNVSLADNVEKMSGASGAAEVSPSNDDNAKNLLKRTNDPESWQLQLTDGGQGDMKVDGDAIVFHVTGIDDTNWHVQEFQEGIALKNGKQYTIRFKAKAPNASSLLLVGAINQEDWHEVGLHEEVGVSDDFKTYEFTFAAGDVVDDNRIGFVLGAAKGTVSVKDLVLAEK